MSSSRRNLNVPVAVRWCVPGALAVLGAGLLYLTVRIEARAASPYPVVRAVPYRPALPVQASPAARAATIPHLERLPLESPFRPGETLSQVLERLGMEPVEARSLSEELARFADPRKLRPLDRYAALLDGEGNLEEFRLVLDGRGRVGVRRAEGAWSAAWSPFERSVERRAVGGRLDSSLDLSIQRAGGESLLAYRLADVLQWDLDFNRDLRAGDRFEILYERVYLDGEPRGLGGILAVVYETRGRRLEAYQFGESDHHYDAEGRPLRKLFLRSPLRYSRVTSSFSHRRFHPVLKSYRPHFGVDYGAPVGTPVRATASGVISFAGWDGGGGRTVKVRHPNGYLTAYLHLSGFARGIGSGRRVAQGEVIGYVGSTGLSTGPHLDYRVQLAGRWINPLSLKSTPADPLGSEELADFMARRDALRAELPWDDLEPATTTAEIERAPAAAPPMEDGEHPTAAG